MKILIAGLASIAGLGTAQAQDIPYATETGRVAMGPLFNGGHLLMFSQNDNVFGTSRSAAMGGAFTSLGADLSAMSINPAGLGMYQSSDWNFTSALSIDLMRTASPNMRAGALTAGGSRTSFSLNNVGAAFNIYSGSGDLTSLTFGIGYNRTANFNSRTSVDTRGEDTSIGDMFARQLTWYNFSPDEVTTMANPFLNENFDLEWWGAALGYQTYIVDVLAEGVNEYGTYDDSYPLDSRFGSVTGGGIHEYNFSIGANFTNKLYLGATVSATDINFSEETTYEEFFAPGSTLGSMRFDQSTSIRGGGASVKLGVIARPVEALRIGVAFHSPTWYMLERSYTAEMSAGEWVADTGMPLMGEFRFTTAPKLLAGVSGVIGGRAIVALDWDVAWYDRIHMRNLSASAIEESKRVSKDLYKPAHTIRAGAEYIVSDLVSVRAGGSYMFDFLRDKGLVAITPATRNGFSVTGGLGFSLGNNGYLDVAYVYNRARMTDYEMYYFDDGTELRAQMDSVNGTPVARTYTPTRHHHMITLTLGNRF
jgi:hypothetical protein